MRVPLLFRFFIWRRARKEAKKLAEEARVFFEKEKK